MHILLLLLLSQTPEPKLADADLRVVAFLGVECPLGKLYAQRLKELQQEFPQVQFRTFAPNRHDSSESVAAFSKAVGLPIEKGPIEAIRLGAKRSPEVFLIHAGRVVYSGRIDDQYIPGRHRLAMNRRDLALAIQQVLAGKPVSVPRSEPVGCFLNLDTQPTAHAKDALQIVYAKCSTCHHPGTAAPFSLLTYANTRDWRATIKEVLDQGRMPPWGAEAGKFANDRRLTGDERRVLLEWIDAGCPDGERVDPPQFSNGWSFTPDLVQEAAAFQVPATGTLDYQEFRLPVFSHDTWVSAVEMHGSRAVHHMNALLEPADADPALRYVVGGDDYLATMVVGNPGIQLPEGMAKLIPANWRIKLEIHYEPIGQPVTDHSSIALRFSNKPRHRVVTQMMLKGDIILQPQALTSFQNSWRMETGHTLLAIFPHMHLRGKSMRVEASLPDQPPELLLDVPRYDYAWQERYVLAEPRSFPAGTVIQVTAQWDNTQDNPSNPDPNQTVYAGKRATDEMFQCSLDVYESGEGTGAGGATFSQGQRKLAWLPLLAVSLALVYSFSLRWNGRAG